MQSCNKIIQDVTKSRKESAQLKKLFSDTNILHLQPVKRSKKKPLQRSTSTSNPELFNLHTFWEVSKEFPEKKDNGENAFLRKFSEPNKLHKDCSAEVQRVLDTEYKKILETLQGDQLKSKPKKSSERKKSTLHKTSGGLDGLKKLVNVLEELEREEKINKYRKGKFAHYDNKHKTTFIHGKARCRKRSSDKVVTTKLFENHSFKSDKTLELFCLENLSDDLDLKLEELKEERKKSKKLHSKWEQVKRAFTSTRNDQRKETTDAIGGRVQTPKGGQSSKSKVYGANKEDGKMARSKKKKSVVDVSSVNTSSKCESTSKLEDTPKFNEGEADNGSPSSRMHVSLPTDEGSKTDSKTSKNIEALLEFSSQTPFTESTAKLKDILNFQKQQAVYFEFPDIVPFSDVMVKNSNTSLTSKTVSARDYSSRYGHRNPLLKSHSQLNTSCQKTKKVSSKSSMNFPNPATSLDLSGNKGKLMGARNPWERMKDIIHSRKGSVKQKKSAQAGKGEALDEAKLMQVLSEKDLSKVQEAEFKQAQFTVSDKSKFKSTPDIYRRKSFPVELNQNVSVKTRSKSHLTTNENVPVKRKTKKSKKMFRHTISFNLGSSTTPFDRLDSNSCMHKRPLQTSSKDREVWQDGLEGMWKKPQVRFEGRKYHSTEDTPTNPTTGAVIILFVWSVAALLFDAAFRSNATKNLTK